MALDYDGPWILLDAEEGRKLLNEAETNRTSSYQYLIGYFNKQIGRFYCGYASSACVLSALKITETDVKEEHLVEDEQLAREVYHPEVANAVGMPLFIVSHIVKFFGGQASVHPMREFDPDLLRSHLKKCVDEKSCCEQNGSGKRIKRAMVVNFLCAKLQLRHRYGHLSVAAAFHEETDKILILDTCPIGHNAWYSIEDMTAAMNTFDVDSNDFRGFVVVSIDDQT